MAKKPETRLRKLRDILNELEQSKPVAKRKLETWLEQDYARVEDDWQQQLQLREELKDKPLAVKAYEELLHKANFWEARAQRASKNRHKSHAALRLRADSAFERALEYLEEQHSLDYSLQQWFDRDLDFSADGALNCCTGAVPLAVTTRSADRQGDGIRGALLTKREVTIGVLESVIRELERDLTVSTQEVASEQLRIDAKLSAFLKRLDED